MTAWVNAALAYVPPGDKCQGRLRNYLNVSLREELGPERSSRTVEQVVRDQLLELQKIGCEPRYDPALLTLDWPDRS
jgi:hypothetical protein